MFTGIIQEVGIIKDKITDFNKYQLKIKCEKVLEDISQGDSIAVNGVCLTVVNYTNNSFTADVMPETLRATNLSKLKNDTEVNLEQAVKANDFLGGHLLTGHVDGIAKVKSIISENNSHIVKMTVDSKLSDFMVDKGSVSLNGVSLTIMRVADNNLTVSLIPETWNFTNLKDIRVGDLINVETDLIAKYVVKTVQKSMKKESKKSTLSKNFLQENGFF